MKNSYTYKTNVCWLWMSLALLFATNANGEMIFSFAERGIAGRGTQLDEVIKTSESLGAYSDDMLISSYARDENNAIVGSVSASASQTSTLTSNVIRGLGRGSGFGSGPAEGFASSFMTTEFSIDESNRFTLAGQLRLAPHGGPAGLNGSIAFVRLTGPDGVVLEVRMDEDNPPDNLGIVDFSGPDQLSGVFGAGTYLLEAFSEGHGSNGLTRCADFDFTLTTLEVAAVPEPAAFAMLLFAGLSCFQLRRRRRR